MKRFVATLFVLAATALAAPRPTQAAYDTYLALGDSVTFGVGSPQFAADGQHNGDRGYVSIVANTLAIQNGGVRPDVVNLAISGETTDSFLGNGGFPNIEGPNAGARNTNYAALGLPANQSAAMIAEFAALASAGHSVDLVTLSIGPNDLFALLGYIQANSIDPANLPAMLQSELAHISTNLVTIFSALESQAPSAQIDVLGTYNPLPTDPTFAAAVAGLNQTIELTVNGFSANTGLTNIHFIDIAPLFVGHETSYTYITSDPGNVHPTPQGYNLIAGQIAPVPEPSSFALIGIGSMAMIALAVRRRTKM